MLTLIICLVLLLSFYTGYRRGFLREVIYVLGYLIAFGAAWLFYKQVGNFLTLWIPYPIAAIGQNVLLYPTADLDYVFYNGLGFVLVFFVGWLIMRFIGVMFYKLSEALPGKIFNHLLGGIINVSTSYIFLVCILTILSVLPVTQIQEQLASSKLVQTMITSTPVISDKIQNEWFGK